MYGSILERHKKRENREGRIREYAKYKWERAGWWRRAKLAVVDSAGASDGIGAGRWCSPRAGGRAE
jgi:hypothetical protein